MGTYYIRSDGSDSNDGSTNDSGNAWLTIEHALVTLEGTGPHTVNVGAGSFAFPSGFGRSAFPSDTGDPTNMFTDWVDIQGAGVGSTTITGAVRLGANSGSSPNFFGTAWNGSFDAYLRFNDVLFDDEFKSYGARYLEFYDCLFNLPTPWTGSSAAIDRTSADFTAGRYVKLNGCEFTDTTTAIAMWTWDSEIVNCSIHDIVHDGIRITGCNNLLVDGCEIYNLDDGVTDAEEPVWSRHCDGIHIYMTGNADDRRNNGITIRNTKVYNCEANAVQFNNYQDGEHRNSNVEIYNCIFGMVANNVLNGAERVDGFKFHHNTVILTQQDNDFVSPYRTIPMTSATVTIRSDWTDVEVYNNLLANVPPTYGVHARVENNVYQARSTSGFSTNAGGKNAIFTTTDQFVDSNAFTGIPISGYAGKNQGTKLDRNGSVNADVPSTDFYGTARDNRPDIGAYEFSGESPTAESTFSYLNDTKTVFVDDFEDGDPFEDIQLGSVAGQRGIAWTPTSDAGGVSNSANFTHRYDHTNSETQLHSPQGNSGPYFYRISNLPSSSDVTIDYHVRATSNAVDDGILLFYADSSNYAWASFGRTSGGTGLRIKIGGVEAELDALSGGTLESGTKHRIIVSASVSANTLDFSATIDGGSALGGSYDITGHALGREFGLIRDTSVADHRMQYVDFELTINSEGAPIYMTNPPNTQATQVALDSIKADCDTLNALGVGTSTITASNLSSQDYEAAFATQKTNQDNLNTDNSLGLTLTALPGTFEGNMTALYNNLVAIEAALS